MRLARLVTGIILLSLIVSIVAGCQQSSLPGTFTDDLGREIHLEIIPQRIVSLAPSNTEILFALGLEDKVVGVTEFADYPEAAKAKLKIGGLTTVDIERVVALEPDLIVATSIHKEMVIPALERLGLTVVALAPKTLDAVLDNIALLGEITGSSQQATQLVDTLEKRIKAITDKTEALAEGPRVFYIVWHDPLMAPGFGTFQDDLIRQAGGINIARDLTGWATISLEAVIEANPEVMIASISHGTGEDLTFQFIKTEPRLRNTDARRNNRVYGVDGNLVSRPGPRIVDGLEQLARFIHPELFGGY